MWKVESDFRKGRLGYYVVNQETGEVKGEFDCEPWAEEFAKELNHEEVPAK
jgi:hypothetical protein